MSDMFNIRSFVGNQVDKLASPKSILVDKFRQTVDTMKLPFTAPPSNSSERVDGTASTYPSSDTSLPPRSSESSSSSSVSSNDPSNHHLLGSFLSTTRSAQTNSVVNTPGLTRLLPSSPPKLMSNIKTLTDRFSRRQSILRRHVSESNRPDESTVTTDQTKDDKSSSQPIYHNNPPIDVQLTSDNTHPETSRNADATPLAISAVRSRSLIRQSTDTTCTFPIRRPMRRMESIETVEIPGLNGVKSIRYLNDNLGKLQPDLYTRQASQADPNYGCGKLTVLLHYNPSINTFNVTIVSVENLPYRDVASKTPPDPYLKILLLPDRRRKLQSKVYKRCQTAQIDETFQFQINYEELRRRVLLFSIYDFGRSSKRSLIGTVKIDDFASIVDLTSHDVTCIRSIVPGTESDPDLGELTVSLCYLPNAKRVTVTIVKASALKSMDITGKSDPYVKVILLIHGKKTRKKKTSVQANTLNPSYNESLEFDLSVESLDDADLIFKVIDYDRVGANELIGCVGIGAHFEGLNRDHWYQMAEHPRLPITQSYNLRETVPIITCTSPVIANRPLSFSVNA